MKNVFTVILVVILVGVGVSLFKGSFQTNTEKLVPDSWEEIKLIKVIDSNTYKVQSVDTGEEIIIKSIFTNNTSSSKVYIDTTLRAASNIYIENDGNYVDIYDNPEVWIWYFDSNGQEHLLQEDLAQKNLVETYNEYSTTLLHEDKVRDA